MLLRMAELDHSRMVEFLWESLLVANVQNSQKPNFPICKCLLRLPGAPKPKRKAIFGFSGEWVNLPLTNHLFCICSQLDLAHAEIVKSDPSLTQCHECRLSVHANALIGHYLDSADNASAATECQECNMMLPNKCSLAAHGRIHEKTRPFVCPECACVFQTFSGEDG